MIKKRWGHVSCLTSYSISLIENPNHSTNCAPNSWQWCVDLLRERCNGNMMNASSFLNKLKRSCYATFIRLTSRRPHTPQSLCPQSFALSNWCLVVVSSRMFFRRASFEWGNLTWRCSFIEDGCCWCCCLLLLSAENNFFFGTTKIPHWVHEGLWTSTTRIIGSEEVERSKNVETLAE